MTIFVPIQIPLVTVSKCANCSAVIWKYRYNSESKASFQAGCEVSPELVVVFTHKLTRSFLPLLIIRSLKEKAEDCKDFSKNT